MHYLDIIKKAEEDGVSVHDFKFKDNLKGLYSDNVIALSKDIETTTEKKCILAEELGHHHVNYGDILDPNNINSVKQEKKGRAWGIEFTISLEKILELRLEKGVRNHFELAEELDVTEDYLRAGLKYFKEKHGIYVLIGDYTLNLDTLEVIQCIASNELDLNRYIKEFR